VVLLSVFLFGYHGSFAQIQQDKVKKGTALPWVVFSPPDGSFQIELPRIPETTKKFNPGKENETDYFRCTKFLESAYQLEISKSRPDQLFQIGVFDITGCKRKSKDFTKETKFLVMIYGVDDPNDSLLVDKEVLVDGYRGRKFLTVSGAGTHVWCLFVETEKRIFWMYFATDEAGGQMSVDAQRILNSFRVEKK
jgi:hypothetical protein